MRATLPLAWFGALLVPGCGGEVETTTIRVDVEVLDIITEDPIEGAEICLELESDDVRCETANEDGDVSFLEVPANQRATWILTADGYVSVMEHLRLGEEDLELLADSVGWAWVDVQSNLFDVDQDRDLSGIGLVASTFDESGELVRVAGVEYTVSGASLEGPYYISEDFGPAPETQVGTGPNGAGTFFNVPPDRGYEISATSADYDCVPHDVLAWPGSAPNAVEVQTRPGHSTYGSFLCTSR